MKTSPLVGLFSIVRCIFSFGLMLRAVGNGKNLHPLEGFVLQTICELLLEGFDLRPWQVIPCRSIRFPLDVRKLATDVHRVMTDCRLENSLSAVNVRRDRLQKPTRSSKNCGGAQSPDQTTVKIQDRLSHCLRPTIDRISMVTTFH